MDNSDSVPPLREAVSTAQSLAREQVLAAWEMLESRWREDLDRIFDERFTEVEANLGAQYAAALADERAALESQLRDSVQRRITEDLNGTARRMKQADSRDVWIRTLLERASQFCDRAALFAIKGRMVRHEGGPGIDQLETAAQFPLDEAPAFAAAIESREPTITTASPREVNEEVAALLDRIESTRLYLFPFSFRGLVVGVLLAEAEDRIDVAALELLTVLAESTIEPPPQPGLVRLGIEEPRNIVTQPAAPPRPVSDEHARAERFARTQVAQILLYKMGLVRTGRQSRDLYSLLRADIDSAREIYRAEFPSAPDYLHSELIARLAQGDASAMGPEYRGSAG